MKIDPKTAGTFRMVPDKLWLHDRTEPVDVMVWLALCLHARDRDFCEPTTAALAETVKVSARTIKRSLARLEDAGFIVGESRGPHRKIRLRPEGWNETPAALRLRAVG